MGATLEGQFDYQHGDVRLRGTFIPAYALNNFLARVPILGMIIGGGQNEGIFGMTYEVVGPPGNATLRVMPMSVFAPGIFRKMFEFRNADDQAAIRRIPRRPADFARVAGVTTPASAVCASCGRAIA